MNAVFLTPTPQEDGVFARFWVLTLTGLFNPGGPKEVDAEGADKPFRSASLPRPGTADQGDRAGKAAEMSRCFSFLGYFASPPNADIWIF